MRFLMMSCVLALGMFPSALLGLATWGDGRDGITAFGGVVLVVRDFVNLWAAGQLWAAGAISTAFDPPAYSAWLVAHVSPGLGGHAWSYPPSMALLAPLFAGMGLITGFVVWIVGTTALLALALGLAGAGGVVTVATILSPPSLENGLAGQNGALTAALLLGGFMAMAQKRPTLAGLLFGLLTIKPHLGLLIPVAIIAGRQWRVAAVAGLTATALVAASALAFGWQWSAFLNNTMPLMRGILERPFAEEGGYQAMLSTPFAALRALGASLSSAYAGQAAVCVAAGCAMWHAWRTRLADTLALVAFSGCICLLASPYGYNYDSTPIAFAVALLASRRINTDGFHPVEAMVLALGWVWPSTNMQLFRLGIPSPAPVLIAAVAWLAYQEARSNQRTPLAVLPPGHRHGPMVAGEGEGEVQAGDAAPRRPAQSLS